MHSYKGNNNNIYHFNGDCSGELIITEVEGNEVKKEMKVDFQDVIDLINTKGYGYRVIETSKIDKFIEDMEDKKELAESCLMRYAQTKATETLPYMLPRASYWGKVKVLEEYIGKLSEFFRR